MTPENKISLVRKYLDDDGRTCEEVLSHEEALIHGTTEPFKAELIGRRIAEAAAGSETISAADVIKRHPVLEPGLRVYTENQQREQAVTGRSRGSGSTDFVAVEASGLKPALY